MKSGKQLGEEGAERAFNAQSVDDWRPGAEACIDKLIASGKQFTADDVTAEVGVPDQPNAVGGLFNSRKKNMVFVGYQRSKRTAAHGRPHGIWQGK